MAGGGTTIDVCKHMARRWIAYDLRSVRPDIQEHDALKPFELPNSIKYSGEKVKLAFLDPPYWKQRRGEYVMGNLADLELAAFYVAIQTIITNTCEVLAESGVIALLIGPTQETREVTDHAADLIRKINLQLKRRIIVPYSTQQHGGAYVNAARENKYPLYLYRDLLIWNNQAEEKTTG